MASNTTIGTATVAASLNNNSYGTITYIDNCITTTATTATSTTSNYSDSTSYNYNGGTITVQPYNDVITSNEYYWTWKDNTDSWKTVTGISNIMSEEEIEKIIDKYLDKKDKDNMNTDFSFGPFNTKEIRLSLYGMAVKNKSGKWVSYDKNTHRLMDVEVFNIDIDSTKVFYKLPKAVNTVAAGDVILHNGRPMFIEEVLDNGKFAVIDPYEGTAVTILAPVSPFGFNFVTQIVSLTDCMPMASEDNPFGNLLPFMLGAGDNSALVMAMMMGKDVGNIDPMMVAMMCGNSNLMPLLLMKMMNKEDKVVE